jgi:hypothetical protein
MSVILLRHFKYFFEVSFYIVQLSVILLSVILPNVVSPFTFFVFEEGANPLFSGPVGRNKNSFCQKKMSLKQSDFLSDFLTLSAAMYLCTVWAAEMAESGKKN